MFPFQNSRFQTLSLLNALYYTVGTDSCGIIKLQALRYLKAVENEAVQSESLDILDCSYLDFFYFCWTASKSNFIK